MTRFSMMCAAVLTGAILLAPRGGQAAEIVYQNDSFGETPEGDGVVQCGFALDEKFGALFVPEAGDYPFSISAIRFALFPYELDGSCVETTPRTGVPVTIEIWNDATVAEAPDTDPIYSSAEWTVETSTDGLIDLPVGSDADLTVTGGVVRVAVTVRALDSMPIHDDDGITAERNYIYDTGGTWHWSSDYSVTGDWLLRLVVDTREGAETDEVEPVPDASEDVLEDVSGDVTEDLEDVVSDVPADTAEDVADDPVEESDGRLGGGGCSCAVAGNRPEPGALAAVMALLVALALSRRRAS